MPLPWPLAPRAFCQFRAFMRGQHTDPGSLHNWLADPGVLDPWASAQIYFYYAGAIERRQWPASHVPAAVNSQLIGLEYWFYYPYNSYPTLVNTGLIDGAPIEGDHITPDLHQGDWEHVTVLLDARSRAPLWLYTARHASEGHFYAWGTTPHAGTHPLVQAAYGGPPTSPPGCGGQARTLLKTLSADWLSCGSGRFAFRAQTTPLVD